MTLAELRERIKLALDENRVETLQGAFNKYHKQGGIYFHYSKLPKLGINPQSGFDTPLGIYAYPLTDDVFYDSGLDKLEGPGVPFAGKRPYVHFFRARRPERVVDLNVLTIDSAMTLLKRIIDANGISELELKHMLDLEDVNESLFESPKLFVYGAKSARIHLPGGAFWYYTWKLQKDTVHWNRLFRTAGIDGCVDTGAGIIHDAEPAQAVFFSGPVIELLETVNNVSMEDAAERRTQSQWIDGRKLAHIVHNAMTGKWPLERFISVIRKKNLMRDGTKLFHAFGPDATDQSMLKSYADFIDPKANSFRELDWYVRWTEDLRARGRMY